ncbi:MAG TPA: glycosyltransferase family 1 protein [Anaerolineales bacterium]|nr:glycosyltransferase family 1 protein [Anaerolineales bacterium]
MRIAINAWFLNQPYTGSGQYLQALLHHLPQIAHATHQALEIVLIAPLGTHYQPSSPVIQLQTVASGAGHLGKLRFEQVSVPSLASKIGADILHIPYWAPPLRSRIPFVVTVHDIIPLMLPEHRGSLLARLYTSLVASATSGANAVITDSHASRLDIQQHLHIPREQIQVIHLAVGAEFSTRRGELDWQVRQKYQLPSNYLLYIGGFHRRKNVHRLLEAWTYCAAPIGEFFPLVIAGKLPTPDGKFFLDYAGMAEQFGIADSVRFLGEFSDAEKPALYRGATGMVFPSSYEGFGLPPLEAMACGVPVITTDKSSLPEVVGSAGYLVSDPSETRKLAAAMIGLTVDQALHSELRAKGLQQAQKFRWEDTTQKTWQVYNSVLLTT